MADERALLRGEEVTGEVIASLSAPEPYLSSRFFYDFNGSVLFEQICELPEYYLTRTECRILEDHAAEFAREAGAHAALVELGAGSSRKARILLRALESPAVYAPVDISAHFLDEESRLVGRDFPELRVIPIVADYSVRLPFPASLRVPGRRVLFYPGSSIGNFSPLEAAGFLHRIGATAGGGALLLIGYDRKKDRALLERAYNDDRGLTARFNRNALAHLNSLIGSDFDLTHWNHLAFYNEEAGRIEMHLQSTRQQTVRMGHREIVFPLGGTIRTEHSYKYHPEEIDALLAPQFKRRLLWCDEDELFSVGLYERSSG